MATDSEIIGAFAANAADIVRLEAALAAKDAEIARWKAVANDLSLDRNRVGLRAEAAEEEVARLTLQLTTGVEQVRAMISEEERVQMVLRDVRRQDKSEAEVALAAAIAVERARCARVAEECMVEGNQWRESIAAAIRAG